MRSLNHLLILTLTSAHSVLSTGSRHDTSSFKPEDIITRDIAIIGGGSSGTHAAITLKDAGKSIIVVEQKGRLGGHTETYTDPATNLTVDYGVIIYHNTSTVLKYFQRFSIPLTRNEFPSLPSLDYDLRTGKQVNVTRPGPEALGAAFQKYAGILAQYPDLNRGMFLPKPVPENLAIPFGEFATKYGIEALVPTMFITNQGAGDMLSLPFVENQRVNGLSLVQQQSTNSFVTTARRNNSELYGAAQAELQGCGSLLLSSTVLSSRRSDSGVELVVSTPSGKKLIRARKLLMTIPPHPSKLAPFDISPNEAALFNKFEWINYATSLVTDTGLPDNLTISNAAADTAYNLPPLPAPYIVQQTSIPGLRSIYYSTLAAHTPNPGSDEAVQKDIVAALKRLQAANPTLYKATEPKFLRFSSHQPFYARVGKQEIQGGFYDELYKLQGQRGTWWTGATWRAQDSSLLWRFNEEVVLPGLVGGM